MVDLEVVKKDASRSLYLLPKCCRRVLNPLRSSPGHLPQAATASWRGKLQAQQVTLQRRCHSLATGHEIPSPGSPENPTGQSPEQCGLKSALL